MIHNTHYLHCCRPLIGQNVLRANGGNGRNCRARNCRAEITDVTITRHKSSRSAISHGKH